MLEDKDRIFRNLYGTGDWRLAGARARGAWVDTKALIDKGEPTESVFSKLDLSESVYRRWLKKTGGKGLIKVTRGKMDVSMLPPRLKTKGGKRAPKPVDLKDVVSVAQRISKIARPKRVIWADDLPKTRSGKIMRRLLRDIGEGRELGDVTTLRDPAVSDEFERVRWFPFPGEAQADLARRG